jgi:hypothetical protein
MRALVAASEKVRPLLNPIGEYNHQFEQLIGQGLSKADARNSLATIAPDLVSTRDNQVIIQRRAQLSAEQRANREENTSRQRL